MKMISKRLLSLLLCICLLAGNLVPAYAADTDIPAEENTIIETEPTEASEEVGVISEEAPIDETESEGQSETPSEEPSTAPSEESDEAPTEESTEETSEEETETDTATGGQFALAVLTVDGIVIAPTYIIYTANQTIAQALLNSEYEFGGLVDEEETSGWIQAVQGVSASYSMFYDNNGFDLTARADTVTALCLTTKADNYSAAYLDLIKTMAEYNASTNGVKDYSEAANAYASAELEIYAATAARAGELQKALASAMEAYEKFASGEQCVLTVNAAGAADIKLTGQFGNTYDVSFESSTDVSFAVAPGEYQFDLSDGGINHVRGSINVAQDTTLTAE